jgi:hypothetical protein
MDAEIIFQGAQKHRLAGCGLGLKARRIVNPFTARLKSGPDTKPSFSATCEARALSSQPLRVSEEFMHRPN